MKALNKYLFVLLAAAFVATGCAEKKDDGGNNTIRRDKRSDYNRQFGQGGGNVGEIRLQFNQQVNNFNQGYSIVQVVEDFLSAERPTTLQGSLQDITVIFQGNMLHILVWDQYARSSNMPFITSLMSQGQGSSGFPTYADQFGEVALVGQVQSNNYVNVYFDFTNYTQANQGINTGVIGMLPSIPMCRLQGGC